MVLFAVLRRGCSRLKNITSAQCFKLLTVFSIIAIIIIIIFIHHTRTAHKIQKLNSEHILPYDSLPSIDSAD